MGRARVQAAGRGALLNAGVVVDLESALTLPRPVQGKEDKEGKASELRKEAQQKQAAEEKKALEEKKAKKAADGSDDDDDEKATGLAAQLKKRRKAMGMKATASSTGGAFGTGPSDKGETLCALLLRVLTWSLLPVRRRQVDQRQPQDRGRRARVDGGHRPEAG